MGKKNKVDIIVTSPEFFVETENLAKWDDNNNNNTRQNISAKKITQQNRLVLPFISRNIFRKGKRLAVV